MLRSFGTGEGKSAEKTQAMRVYFASIGPRRDSRPNDHTPRQARILFPIKTPVLTMTVAHRNFWVSKIRMTNIPDESVVSDFECTCHRTVNLVTKGL
jgi:hypothetical protein